MHCRDQAVCRERTPLVKLIFPTKRSAIIKILPRFELLLLATSVAYYGLKDLAGNVGNMTEVQVFLALDDHSGLVHSTKISIS